MTSPLTISQDDILHRRMEMFVQEAAGKQAIRSGDGDTTLIEEVVTHMQRESSKARSHRVQ